MKVNYFTVPNIITLGSLFCGCMAAVHALVYHDLILSFWFIALAAVLDFCDGFAARLLGQYSELGKQLDSLSDMVSFGFAPSAVLYSLFLYSGGMSWWEPGLFITFFLALFSALRLARFNIDTEQKEEFIGLPTPAAALIVASVGWCVAVGKFSLHPGFYSAGSVLLGILLILPVRMFSLKFKGFDIRDNLLRYVFLIVSLALFIIFRIPALPWIMLAYIVVSLFYSALTTAHSNN